MTNDSDCEIADLRGRQLSAVVFVQDYLQLQFDGTVLTATQWPRIESGSVIEFGAIGYRDALCSFITHDVTEARVVIGDSFTCTFDDGRRLVISLLDCDRTDPEVVRLDQEDGRWFIW